MFIRHISGNIRLFWVIVMTALLGMSPCASVAFTITFEGLADGDPVANQYASQGVTFTGVYTAASGAVGGTLNEIDFPPTSGDTVLTNDPLTGITPPDVMTIAFGSPLSQLSAYFIYYIDTDGAGSPGSLLISAYTDSNQTLLRWHIMTCQV